ncbi:hypothetical protein RI129_005765 [Pyrocoelia pectoralis]|uniref:Beta-N-acetylhexosaminidase n=1 Tax=Pyrocoelia pectoralis TaxID=417401 RepID=A0AAN7ZFM3_9COLE
MFAKALTFCFIFIQFSSIENKQSVYIINGKKPLNVVSERFLSFSIEPNDFLENLNDVQYMFQHLKPAFIRIAGQSTKNIQFSAENSSVSSESKHVITPLVWKQVYRWFVNTSLTPVFSINNGLNDTWSPEILRPFFETNEEIGFNCYWEMGYDCDTKLLPKYQEDLKSLKRVIERYPSATIVGGNTYSCTNIDLTRKVMEELNGTVEAIVWETSFAKRNVVPMSETPTWIIMQQAKYPETFASALQWARHIAESAGSSGYKVVFWKTSVKSLPDSVPFWIALLHKRLVGTTVLDISTNSRMQNGVEVSAHCAKQYSSQGALVLFIVNEGINNVTVPILVASLHPKTIEVQSYIVTSNDDNTIYCNGEKLSRSLLNTDHLVFIPKLQTFQVQSALNLNVPSKSVSFFVLPRAGMAICGYNNNTKDDILLLSRFNPTDSTKVSRLDVFKQKLEELKNVGQRKFGDSKAANDFNDFLTHKHGVPKLKKDKTSKLGEKPLKDKINSDYPRQIALELTKDEIKQILLERAKSRIEENNMSISNKELERTRKRVEVQKFKRFATVKPLKRRSNNRLRGKKHVKRDTGIRLAHTTFQNGGNVFADFAPANYGERDVDDTKEDVLRSGEQYVDERLKFLKGSRNGDSEVDEKSEYSIYEDFGSNNREDKLEFMGDGMRWMQHARVKRDTRSNVFKSKIDSNRINHVIVKKRQNTDRDIAAKLKSLKEKVENRIKMNNWIRNKQKKNVKDSRSRRTTVNEHNAFAYYTPKVLNGRLTRDNDVKVVKKMPSYSREEVVEFPPNKAMKRRSERALTDVDSKENLIEDERYNKITKMKAPMESVATPPNTIPTTDMPIYNSTMKHNQTENNTEHVSFNKEASEGGKSFFQVMLEQVATFIENIIDEASYRTSCVKDESGGWFNVLPSKSIGSFLDDNTKDILFDNTFRIAATIRIGSGIFVPFQCICGSKVEERGHGLSCSKDVERWARHSVLNELIKNGLSTAQIPSILEPAGMFRDDEKFPLEIRTEIVNRIKGGCAPLFIACKRGQTEVVEYLITVCRADLEQRGLYEVPDERSVHYATPLWCAAVSGKLSVVQRLVHYGADINSVSDTGSTPVRSACFMTHLEIVHYLVEHGADINRANYNGGTCLINSVQSVVLCNFLLNHGACVNARDIQSKTALHYAIQEHRLETTQLLIKHGADYFAKSRYGDDALQTACLKGAVRIFDYLVSTIDYSTDVLVNAHELLGSTFIHEHNDIIGAVHHWRTAIYLRESESSLLPKTPIMHPRASFRFQKEFSSSDELDNAMTDLDSIRIQSLLVTERILGPYHKDTVFRLMFRGASYVDVLRFQRCIDLWRRALEIRIEKDTILYSDTCFTAQALVKLMVDFNERRKCNEISECNDDQRFEDVVAVYELLVEDLEEARELAIIQPSHKRQVEGFDRVLRCITHLIYLMIQIANTYEKKVFVQRLIVNLRRINPKTITTEDSLVHLCVSKLNTLRSSYFMDEESVPIFPQREVIELLLDCGFDVNSRNGSNSTPLHIASSSYNFNSWLIKLLLEYGAHIDQPNSSGKRPTELLALNPLNDVYVLNYITLKCLCATVINKYKIRYRNQVPKSLEYLIQQHEH